MNRIPLIIANLNHTLKKSDIVSLSLIARDHSFLLFSAKRFLSPKFTVSSYQNNYYSSSSKKNEESTLKTSSQDLKNVSTESSISEKFVERYIPVTRRSVIRHLMQEKDFLTEDENKQFEKFCVALDGAISNRYHSLHQELKILFDPINPDKDTIVTRKLNKKERLDNEFWLLQKLSSIMQKANFYPLPSSYVDKILSEHNVNEGVKVSVNRDRYAVLRFWALGMETLPNRVTALARLRAWILRQPRPPPAAQFYKRVVVAVRLKRDDKLLLKAFKSVPTHALEKLLPDGRVHMNRMDRTLIITTVSIATAGLLAKVVTWLAHLHVDSTVLVSAVCGLAAARAWASYKNRHNAYLLELSRTLYFKNVANNRGLLALLVDRAEDELFKEVLLVYSFLLTNRPPSARTAELAPDTGVISAAALENQIQDWVLTKTGTSIRFDSSDALAILQELRIASTDLNNNLYVLPMSSACSLLPQDVRLSMAAIEEHDLGEGYDRDVSQETDEEYKDEEKSRKGYGWTN